MRFLGDFGDVLPWSFVSKPLCLLVLFLILCFACLKFLFVRR